MVINNVRTQWLQWSHVFSDMVSKGHGFLLFPLSRASMEPCLFRHGKKGVCFVVHRYHLLQWSHVFSDMVRIIEGKLSLKCTYASMEPCLFRHGKHTGDRPEGLELSRLQWSHVFSDMVSPLRSMSPPEPATRFNGAMSFQTW